MPLCWVRPGFDDFQYEEVELLDQTGIDIHAAFNGKSMSASRASGLEPRSTLPRERLESSFR
jgi:hypothetical protein